MCHSQIDLICYLLIRLVQNKWEETLRLLKALRVRQGPVEEGSVKIETINLNYLLIKQTGNYCSVSAMDYKLKWTPNELLLNLSEDKQCM